MGQKARRNEREGVCKLSVVCSMRLVRLQPAFCKEPDGFGSGMPMKPRASCLDASAKICGRNLAPQSLHPKDQLGHFSYGAPATRGQGDVMSHAEEVL
jgi:hypothetical protein